MDIFNSCCANIDEAYMSLGHNIGWRFLSGPKENLNGSTPIAFISLNPGGKDDPPGHPHESQEEGSAYRVESWDGKPPGQSKLQVQVCTMFRLLAERLAIDDPSELMDKTLMGQFIPFRSPDFASLGNKEESIAFAQRIWAQIFQNISPRLIITMDALTFKHLRKIITDGNPVLTEQHSQMPTGWGTYQSDIVRFGVPEKQVTLVRFPHLSRFTLFTSSKCKVAMFKIMDEIVNRQGYIDAFSPLSASK